MLKSAIACETITVSKSSFFLRICLQILEITINIITAKTAYNSFTTKTKKIR